MHAVDTNVLTRMITGDPADQAESAARLFSANSIWISKTVLLETSWVLQSVYGFSEDAVVNALDRVVGLPQVSVEDLPCVDAALELRSAGLDFADALHVCSRPSEVPFMTFDKTLVKRAQRAGLSGVSELRSKRGATPGL